MALFASDTVALDIGSYTIKGAVVNPRSGLKKYAAVPTPQGAAIGGTINNPEELVAALKQLWQMLGAKGSDVISAVPSQYVFVRNFTLPMMKKSELEQAVKFQTEGQIPLPPAELVLDFAVLSEDKKAKQMEVMVAATRRSVIQQMVQILAQAELNAKVFDLESLALSRVFLNTERKQAGDGWDMFISTGANTTHISIFERNRLLFTRSIPFGGFRFTRALSMEQSISVDEAEERKLNGELPREHENIKNELATELRRSIEYFQSQNKEKAVTRLILCGGGSRLANLTDFLTERLNLPVGFGQFTKGIKIPKQVAKTEQLELLKTSYAPVLGLAARRKK